MAILSRFILRTVPRSVGLASGWAVLLAGCGSVEMPAMLKSPAAVPAKDLSATPPPTTTVDSPLSAGDKRITSVAPKASIMLEKECPTIVQPYTLTANASTIGAFILKQGTDIVANSLEKAAGTGQVVPVQNSKISASSKLAAKQLNWLPMTAEVMYGERSHKTETRLLDRDSKQGKKVYPIADAMLKEVLDNVGQAHAYAFKLFILREPSRNALSRPGGYLYVDKGLLDNPVHHPKAYFAIAHEVSHVLQRHETFELQSMIIDTFSVEDDMKKAIAEIGSNPAAVVSRVSVGKNMFIRHHMDQELQADACATRLLSRVFPARQQLEKSLNAFIMDLPKAGPALPSPAPVSAAERLAASVYDIVDKPVNVHPNSTERVTNLKKMYAVVTQQGTVPGTVR